MRFTMKLTTILFTILFSTSVFAASAPAEHNKKKAVETTTTEKTVEETATEKTEEKK